MEKKQILFIDDEADWRLIIKESLGQIGHEVLTAADATEALRLTEGASLGLIIVDLNLAGEDGLSLMKYLRVNQPGVPILIYTGMEHDETAIAQMRLAGANQYLRKGNLDELVAAVRRSFKH